MNACFIFDIDGVITEPLSKIPNPFIISFIAQQLNKKHYVAIETGRALSWVGAKILKLIQAQLEDINNLDYLFIACEKGSLTATFVNGIITTTIDTGTTIPQDVQDTIRQYIKEKKGIFFDTDKQTMISVEIDGGIDKEMLEDQKKVLAEFEIWVRERIISFHPSLMLDISPISVDIQSKDVSKKIASTKFLEFLKNKKNVPSSFIAIGDTIADIDIAEVIFATGKSVQFAYVGEKPLEKKYPFPIIICKNSLYDKAAEDFLRTQSI